MQGLHDAMFKADMYCSIDKVHTLTHRTVMYRSPGYYKSEHIFECGLRIVILGHAMKMDVQRSLESCIFTVTLRTTLKYDHTQMLVKTSVHLVSLRPACPDLSFKWEVATLSSWTYFILVKDRMYVRLWNRTRQHEGWRIGYLWAMTQQVQCNVTWRRHLHDTQAIVRMDGRYIQR